MTDKAVPIKTILEQTRCPDCDADLSVEALDVGVMRVTVAHDETCPSYQVIENRRERRRREREERKK